MTGGRRTTMAVTLLLLLPALAGAQSPAPAAAGAGPVMPAPPTTSSPRALALADEVMKALGGTEAWNATRFLRFDFGFMREGVLFARAHTWDKHTGRYRLEAKTREGDPYLVLMNLNTRKGDAWLKGARVSGEEEKKLLDQAYGAWVNDTYWLIMPYKLRDSGVILGDAGKKPCGSESCDVLELAFDGVGLTPKDRYWVYVNPTTRLVDQWEYVLKGEAGSPTNYVWSGWKRHGRIMLASDRENVKEGRKILFPVLGVSDAIDDAVFTSPETRFTPPAPSN